MLEQPLFYDFTDVSCALLVEKLHLGTRAREPQSMALDVPVDLDGDLDREVRTLTFVVHGVYVWTCFRRPPIVVVSRSDTHMKEIYCAIHQTIAVPDTIIRIIDTPPFQRLRHVKQLGAASYVFPTATHTRFEHSIGVGHLARLVVEQLQRTGVPITDHEKDLLQLAGTLHDVGHGPFSHLFEQVYPDEHHEERSCNLVRELMASEWSTDDIEFVCNVIIGNGDGYLYEIVNNKHSGFDVDKWDYIVRDSTMIGFRVNVNFQRFIANMRVVDNHLCFNHKVYDDIYEIYRMRCLLHRKVYNHHAVIGIECMLVDILRDIDATPDDIDAVIHSHRDHPLVQRLYRRDHYRVVATKVTNEPLLSCDVETDEFVLSTRRVGLGRDGVHPMTRIRFYRDGDALLVKPACDMFVSNRVQQYWTRVVFKKERSY